MESVEVKFTNFKQFLKDNVADNQHVNLIMNSNLSLFLRTLKNYENLTEENLYNHIINITKINIENFSPDIILKFKRYLQYFRKVSIM